MSPSDEADGADGAPGVDGITPHIGDNGNWYLGDTDTGKTSRGETGPAGSDGKDGADGAPGVAGSDGAPGADGKSAYQYAVDGGYTGTEAEFAAKLAEEMPDKLPNPNALTFTGAVTGSYDGSAPLSIDIPSVGESSEEEWETICEINGFDADLYMYEVNSATGPVYKKVYLLILNATANTTKIVYGGRGVSLPDVYRSTSDDIAYRSIIDGPTSATAYTSRIYPDLGFYSMTYFGSGIGVSANATLNVAPLGNNIPDPDSKIHRFRYVYTAGGIQNIRIYQNSTTVPIPTNMQVRIMGVRA